jgi:glycosyltransferase involved in cell wall biosynthesis
MPLVSVIIPTHNRAQYAVPTIRSVLATSPDIEVVVCDTSEVDLISSEFKDDHNCKRLRLIRPNRPMSVVDNFNEALSGATGDYLVFIGDDDFVSNKIVEVARWASNENVDSLKFSFPVLYYWPDFEHRVRGDFYAGTLHIAKFTGAICEHDAKKSLVEALNNFGGGVMEMPRAYAGMVSRTLVDKVCERYGALFGGVSPDIYSATLISVESNRCVKIDYPIVIPGASSLSTAGLSANGKHVGGLRDNSHIAAFKNLIWDERIPEFYSVPTVWSYSLLKAAEKINLKHEKINFSRLYVKCLIYQRPYFHLTIIAIKAHVRLTGWSSLLITMISASIEEFKWIVSKISDRVLYKFSPSALSIVRRNLPDVPSASDELDAYLSTCAVKLNLRIPKIR